MNIVIAAEKKYNKLFTDCLQNEKHNLIGYETKMKSNFIKRISEHYNPHILVVVNGVKSRRYDFFASLSELTSRCSTLRIIYLFGRINENNEQEYLDTVEVLGSYGIYDVLPFDLYERGFKSRFLELIESPMTADILQQLIADRQKEENTSEIFVQKLEKIIDNTPVYLNKAEIENTEYSNSVITVDEQPEKLNEDLSDHITIAVGTISDRQAGCTLTAFEIAVTLKEMKQSTAIFLDGEIYNNYVAYHGIIPSEANEGCEINGLVVYPLVLYAEKRNSVKFSICDYGYSQINPDSSEHKEFAAAEIKICICSFNEWDINILANYLNSPLPYIKEINYIFFPVSQANFVKFQKQMTKGHCKAFRIRNSPDYTIPCDWNKHVYNEIFTKYVRIEKPKKRFGLF